MGLTRFEKRIKVRGAKLFGQTNLTLPISDHPLNLAGTEIWNRDGFFSATQPTRVTVPSGYGDVYSVHAVVHWAIGVTGQRFLPDIRDGNYFITKLAKNGSVAGDLREARVCDGPRIPARINRQEVFWEAALQDGDFIEVLLTCAVVDQQIMNLYGGLYGAAWFYRVEHWLTIRRLGRLP